MRNGSRKSDSRSTGPLATVAASIRQWEAPGGASFGVTRQQNGLVGEGDLHSCWRTVPVVCAHGLRGTHASLAVMAGATSHQVFGALNHESFEVTRNHYLINHAIEVAQIRNAERLLERYARIKFPRAV